MTFPVRVLHSALPYVGRMATHAELPTLQRCNLQVSQRKLTAALRLSPAGAAEML